IRWPPGGSRWTVRPASSGPRLGRSRFPGCPAPPQRALADRMADGLAGARHRLDQQTDLGRYGLLFSLLLDQILGQCLSHVLSRLDIEGFGYDFRYVARQRLFLLEAFEEPAQGVA